jgi:glycosyltransferase involved in cell wall biosynthesis
MSLNIAIVNPILCTLNIEKPFLEHSGPAPVDELAEVNIVQLASAIADLGHRVTVYASDVFLNSEEVNISNKVKVRAIPTKLQKVFHPGLLPFTPSLLLSSKLKEADIIQASEFHQFSTFLSSQLASKANIPFVVWQETFEHWRPPGQCFQQLFNFTAGHFIRNTSTMFIPRTKKANNFLIKLGIAQTFIGPWIPTGIDGKLFKPQSRKFYPDDFGLPKDFALIIVVGRLVRSKGVDIAIRAEALLRKKQTKVGLLVRGSGPELANLKALANALGVADYVKFLGQQSKTTLAKLYNSADILIIPSRKDLFPFVLLEAAGCALPSISTRVGCINDFVKDGDNGLLVKPNSPEDIVIRVKQLLNYPVMREDLGKSARRFFLESFDLPVVAKRFEQIYHSSKKAKY